MKKTDLVKASERKDHIQRRSSTSLNICSKALQHVSEQTICDILSHFDQAYADLMAENDTPERKVFCIKTATPVATDAIISEDELKEGAVFEVMRDLGTPYAAKVKVALINRQDMPTTNLVHGVYGPYGKSGKAGIYLMSFGNPGMPLPKELSASEPEHKKAYNRECLKFWNGENGRKGHVILATPDELLSTIEQMKKFGMPTKTQELRLEAFRRGGSKSPLKEQHRPATKSKNAIDLGQIKLSDKLFERQYQ